MAIGISDLINSTNISTTTTSGSEPTLLQSINSNYTVEANTYSLRESETVIFNITTVGVDDYTVLYWTNDGTTVANDFTDGIMGGSITIVSNTAQVEKTLSADMLSEGGESIIFTLRGDSIVGPVLAVSPTVLVEDSSQSPYPPPLPYPDGEIPIETILGGFATIGYTGSQGFIGYTGSRGLQGYTGSQGIQGDGLVILGKLTDTTELPYPYTGNKGDGYLIGTELYTWDGDTWNNVGDIVGPRGYTGSQGERGLDLINTANDVDVTELKDGSLLVFKEDSSKWTSTTLLDKQIFDGGHY